MASTRAISSSPRTTRNLTPIPGLRQRFHNYTVFVRGRSFTVTQPTDQAFLRYFYDRCVAPEEMAPSPEHKMQGIIGRLLHWLDQPVTGAGTGE